VNETREAEELVRLWQELQAAEVAGDAGRISAIRTLADANARRPEASGEWALLAREAARHLGGGREQVKATPTPHLGDETTAAEPEGVEEVVLADDEPGRGGGLRLGPLIWVVVVVGYLLLQLLGNVGEGGG